MLFRSQPRSPRPQPVEINWDDLKPRHVVAGCGGFLAALGIAFTAIAQSRLALAFSIAGLSLAAVGFYAEIGNLLRQAVENIARASKEAAEWRLRSKELALEKQRLDLEAARLAQEQAVREAPVVAAAVLANQPTEYVPEGQASLGPHATHRPDNGCESAIDRAILRPAGFAQPRHLNAARPPTVISAHPVA